jgi:hypothetical protein
MLSKDNNWEIIVAMSDLAAFQRDALEAFQSRIRFGDAKTAADLAVLRNKATLKVDREKILQALVKEHRYLIYVFAMYIRDCRHYRIQFESLGSSIEKLAAEMQSKFEVEADSLSFRQFQGLKAYFVGLNVAIRRLVDNQVDNVIKHVWDVLRRVRRQLWKEDALEIRAKAKDGSDHYRKVNGLEPNSPIHGVDYSSFSGGQSHSEFGMNHGTLDYQILYEAWDFLDSKLKDPNLFLIWLKDECGINGDNRPPGQIRRLLKKGEIEKARVTLISNLRRRLNMHPEGEDTVQSLLDCLISKWKGPKEVFIDGRKFKAGVVENFLNTPITRYSRLTKILVRGMFEMGYSKSDMAQAIGMKEWRMKEIFDDLEFTSKLVPNLRTSKLSCNHARRKAS